MPGISSHELLASSETEVETQLAELEGLFRAKHQNLFEIFADHYEMARAAVPVESTLSRARQLLVGACFTMEYALESVALFNPSIVPAMSQEGIAPGAVRFVMSLRATGEGHISSIVSRTGVIHADGDIRLDAPAAAVLCFLRQQVFHSSMRQNVLQRPRGTSIALYRIFNQRARR